MLIPVVGLSPTNSRLSAVGDSQLPCLPAQHTQSQVAARVVLAVTRRIQSFGCDVSSCVGIQYV